MSLSERKRSVGSYDKDYLNDPKPVDRTPTAPFCTSPRCATLSTGKGNYLSRHVTEALKDGHFCPECGYAVVFRKIGTPNPSGALSAL